jgi:broad specificity phosphatase PhoE
MPTNAQGKRFSSKFRMNRHARENKQACIYVMRHGQTALDKTHRSDGWIDLSLSDDGKKNVVATLADYLQEIPITCIYCSDLLRTEETAHIIQSGLVSHPKVIKCPEARTWNLGSLAGNPKKPNKKIVKDLLEHPSKSAPDGESYDEFKSRFDTFVEDQQKDAEKDGPLLLVLSGSNCRRISEMLYDDRSILDIDEAGLFMMYKSSNNSWSAKVIFGHRDEDEQRNNPEAS